MIGKEQILIFLHIAKAAGSTLHSILEKQYRDIGHFFTAGSPENQDHEKIMQLTQEERNNIGVVRGHVNYGVHKLFPKAPIYITMLREPIDRIISHYYYIRRDPNHYLYQRYVSENWTLEDYIYATVENDNGQTRALAGVLDIYTFFKKGQSVIPFGECSYEILELAKKNLQKFALIGLTERFDESLILLKRALDWMHPPLYIKQNISLLRPRKEEIPIGILDLIQEYNKLDMELYKYAAELFEKQVLLQGDTFGIEVEYFKMLNKAYKDYDALSLEHEVLLKRCQRDQQSKIEILARKLERLPIIGRLFY